MFTVDQSYELAQMRHAEWVEKAALQRLLRPSKQQPGSVAKRVRQISFRLHRWVVTVSFIHDKQVNDETHRAPI